MLKILFILCLAALCLSFAAAFDNTAVINVTDFGAVPNDTLDDTAAIQNALHQGGSIYFPAGVYLISASLNVSSGSILSGPGTLKLSETVATNIPILSISNQKSRISIRGLTLNGNGGGLNSGGNVGAVTVTQPSCSEITLSDLTIINARDHGIELENATQVTVKSCRITGFTGRGINIVFCWDCTVQDNYLDGASGTQRAEHGIQIWGNWKGAIAAGNFTITGNTVKNVNGGGIWGAWFESGAITGNQVEGCGDVGIDLEGCRQVSVTENTVKNCVNGCITTFHGSNSITINKNQITQTKSCSAGIKIYGNGVSENISITGNQVEVVLGSYCIYSDMAALSNSVIQGNLLKNGRGTAIRLLSANNMTIAGNAIVVGDLSNDSDGSTGIDICGGNDCIINDNTIESLQDNSPGGSGGGIYLYWASSSYPCQRNTVINNIIRGFTTSINDNCWGNVASYNCIKNNWVNTIYRRAGIYYNGVIESNFHIDNPDIVISATEY